MLEEEGKSAGAETNIPAEVADKSKKKPPARLRIVKKYHKHTEYGDCCAVRVDSVAVSLA